MASIRSGGRKTKEGQKVSPVKVEDRVITETFWGQAWCRHLEFFGAYKNRLPRGRTYVIIGDEVDSQ